jgi:hypothetical protein
MSIISYPYSMWRPDDVQLLVDRILQLRPDSRRRWGTMSVAGMLAHCTLALEVYSRDYDLPMHIRWYAPISKWFALSKVPFPRGARLPFELPQEDGLDFEMEKLTLIRALHSFASLPSSHEFKPHFLLGAMSREEFGILAHKHTAHHLRQFGV